MSIDDFDELPEPHLLQQRCRALALLETICNTDRTPRNIRFRHDEKSRSGLALSHYRDETDNMYTVTFGPPGVMIYGFDCDYRPDLDHPACPEEDGALRQAPTSLVSMVPTPAVTANFWLWKTRTSTVWNCGDLSAPDDEAVAVLWPLLSNDLESIRTQVFEEYYDILLPRDLTAELFHGRPISPALVRALNARVDIDGVLAEAHSAGAPATLSTVMGAVHPVSDSAMVDAVVRRDYNLFRTLLRTDPFLINEPDSSGRTAVHWSVILRETPMLAHLLAAGADFDRTDHFGATPMTVIRQDDHAAAKLLLAARAGKSQRNADFLPHNSRPIDRNTSTPQAKF